MAHCKCDEPAGSTFPIPNTSTGGCTSTTANTCPPSLNTPAISAQIRAAVPRTQVSPLVIAALAPATTTTVLTVPANGEPKVISLDDLVSSLASLDAMQIVVAVGGVEQLNFAGGKFSRTNANPCTGCPATSVCVGPAAALTVTVTNISASAFAAGESATLWWHPIYMGEPGFAEGCGCAPAAPAAPTGTSFSVQEVG